MASVTFRRADYKQLEVWINGRKHTHLDSAYGIFAFLTEIEGASNDTWFID